MCADDEHTGDVGEAANAGYVAVLIGLSYLARLKS